MSNIFKAGEEEQQLQESIAAALSAVLPFERISELCRDLSQLQRKAWSAVRELGLFEYFAGLDSLQGAAPLLALIAESEGRNLFPGQLAQSLLGGPLLLAREQQLDATVRDGINSGAMLVSFCSSRSSNGRMLAIELPATSAIIDLQLGKRAPVAAYFPDQAARSAAKPFEIDLLRRTCWLDAAGGETRLLSRLPAGSSELVALLHAAELAGVAGRVTELTREYACTRKQFGAAIGSFQAVQHRLADMRMISESLSALVRFAAWSHAGSPKQFSLAANAALRYAIEHVAGVVESAIQLHGGLGFTWEYGLHLFLRRTWLVRLAVGSMDKLDAALVRDARKAMAANRS